jgi:CelD/BcsL family acetyltransferase involved in cellulose biosynthesis
LISNLKVTQEDFDSLTAYLNDPGTNLRWNLIFTLPAWLRVWWQNFGSGAELYIRAVRQNDNILGIAPLQIRESTASIIGSVDVCDYQDFIVVPGRERDFFDAILDDLSRKGTRRLHLETIRTDSSVVTYLMPRARERGYQIDYHQTDVSSEMDLPSAWDEYLDMLDRKQKHELKRKMRNLKAIGETNFRIIADRESSSEAIDSFLKMFPESRGDKARFMTEEMKTFFRGLTGALAEIGIIRFGLLEVSARPVAMIMYFDYNENIYLYNSAYDPIYKSKSVGIISKARCIQDSIEKGKKRFDFLKGAEQYKYYLGGKEILLYSCEITLER